LEARCLCLLLLLWHRLTQYGVAVVLGVSESMHVLANEPSMALFRVEEHVIKSVPELVEQKKGLAIICDKVQGAMQDLEYGVETVAGMKDIKHIGALHKNIQRALLLLQQGPLPPPRAAGRSTFGSPVPQQHVEATVASPKFAVLRFTAAT
jgi:hypothetical protein